MNVDPKELEKFSDLAHRWWDPESDFKPLHEINPLRLDYIDRAAGLNGRSVLDVGCGGGILSESMAARGANVTGIDLSEKALGVARLHLFESRNRVDYQMVSAEEHALERAGSYDVVTCMEMLEHVPDPSSVVQACSKLTRIGGQIFFSTLNRNLKSYVFAVLGAEYVLGLLPRGTHEYGKFIRPAELARYSRSSGLRVDEIVGMSYNPLTRIYALTQDPDVNYLVKATRIA